jgi:hypothetical protein
VPPNDESRPVRGGPATITNHHGSFTLQDAPVENLLARLERVRKSPRGWTASCPGPNHRRGDQSPCLSIAEADDGRTLLFCFGGCRTEEIVAAVGLELRDLFPRRDDRRPPRPRPRSRPVTIPAPVARVLVQSGQFAKEWTIAKALAELAPRQQRADVLTSWDHLSEHVDIPAVLELAALVRGAAFFRFCSAGRCEDADVARVVRRLVEEVETNG